MELLREFLTPTPAVLAALIAVVLWHVLKTEKKVGEMAERPPCGKVGEEDDGLPAGSAGGDWNAPAGEPGARLR